MLEIPHILDPLNEQASLLPTQFNRGLAAKIHISADGNVAMVVLGGRFDFYAHIEFRHASEEALKTVGVTQIEIDMNNVEYLDSSALGMLLILREKANNANRKLSLSNCKDVVLRVLEVANFNKLFTIK
jgi:HptB-dependent secretion and biofilm anti anti-sigma factor